MSRDFLDNIPEELRGVWNTAPEPNPMKTHFNTLNEVELLKERIRNTSNLFKYIFGESMFAFVTASGELNLDIRMVNIESLIKDIDTERSKQADLQETIEDIGSGRVMVLADSFEGAVIPESLKGKAFIEFDAQKVSDFYKQNINDICVARKDVMEKYSYYTDTVVEEISDPVPKGFRFRTVSDKYTYLTRDERPMIDGVMRMINEIGKQATPYNSIPYFRLALVAKPLRLAFADINWRRDL